MPGVLPFSMAKSNREDSRPWQLRLAMFHRANPEISWRPFNYGFANTRDVDGVWRDRSWDALQSWLDFRFGKGVVTTYKSRPGVQVSSMLQAGLDALYEDTPYANDPATAQAYYWQSQGERIAVPSLPKALARSYRVDCACSVPLHEDIAGLGSSDGLSWNDQNSIFGRTYQGVPNPQIGYQHAYPTRYHGPIFTTPRFGLPFQANPMAVAPFSGLGDVATDFGLSAAVAQALQPVVSQAIASSMPTIVAGVQAEVDRTAKDYAIKAAIGAGVIAAGLAGLIIVRTAK